MSICLLLAVCLLWDGALGARVTRLDDTRRSVHNSTQSRDDERVVSAALSSHGADHTSNASSAVSVNKTRTETQKVQGRNRVKETSQLQAVSVNSNMAAIGLLALAIMIVCSALYCCSTSAFANATRRRSLSEAHDTYTGQGSDDRISAASLTAAARAAAQAADVAAQAATASITVQSETTHDLVMLGAASSAESLHDDDDINMILETLSNLAQKLQAECKKFPKDGKNLFSSPKDRYVAIEPAADDDVEETDLPRQLERWRRGRLSYWKDMTTWQNKMPAMGHVDLTSIVKISYDPESSTDVSLKHRADGETSEFVLRFETPDRASEWSKSVNQFRKLLQQSTQTV